MPARVDDGVPGQRADLRHDVQPAGPRAGTAFGQDGRKQARDRSDRSIEDQPDVQGSQLPADDGGRRDLAGRDVLAEVHVRWCECRGGAAKRPAAPTPGGPAMILSKRERYIGIATGAVVALLALDRFVFTPLMERRT